MRGRSRYRQSRGSSSPAPMIVPTSRVPFSRPGSTAFGTGFLAALPALGTVLFAAWCGSFYIGASAYAAIAAQLLLLGGGAAGFLVGGGSGGPNGDRSNPYDPLDLGPGGLHLLGALLAVVALSWWLSPVPRAGLVGALLLPAFLVLPAAVAAAWRRERARRVGARWVAAGVVAVAFWALGRWMATGGDLPAEPLGQHLLLATWLVALLPLAAVRFRSVTGEDGVGEARRWRALAGGAVAVGVVTVLATRSFAGALALAVEVFVLLAVLPPAERASPRALRVLRAAAGVAILVVVALGAAAARQGDPSLAARLVYWKAGWQGVVDRPLVGYGPGSTAWTLAGSLRPVPGVNPPQEVVGELHLAPLAVAYEIGLPGLVLSLTILGLFVRRRLREMPTASDPALAAAGVAGLVGTAVMGFATADWRVTALPVAAAVAAGAALAGARRVPVSTGADAASSPSGVRRRAVVALLYLVAAGAVLLPLDRAHRLYDRAFVRGAELASGSVGISDPGPAELLRRAVRLDPEFPLYRFHAARQDWRTTTEREGAQATAREALLGAELGRGVAALWLRGGAAAAAAGSPEIAAPAFEMACALDPLGAMAPFSLLAVGSPLHRREALGARVLAAEPRLGAATFWDERPDLLEAVLQELSSVDGIDAGWREEVVSRVRSLPRGAEGGRVATVAVVVDGRPSASLSLHAFRRLPWRVDLVPVPVRVAGVRALSDLPPATILPGTDPRLFPATCTGPFAPQILRKTLWKTW